MQLAAELLSGMVHALNAEDPIEHGVWIGKTPEAFEPSRWQAMNPDDLVREPLTTRYDLGVVNAVGTDSLSKLQISVITRLRDLLAKQVLVAAAPSACLYELGFKELETEAAHDNVRLWQYNILSYKPVPDWLNAKFWANPENWDKYRW